MKPQIEPMDVGRRPAEARRVERVMGMIHELPARAQQAIRDSLSEDDRRRYGVSAGNEARDDGHTRPMPRTGARPLRDGDVAQPPSSDWPGRHRN
jgi:phospholipid/cholesterol/gamma-HCH transport system ATP-binding protein